MRVRALLTSLCAAAVMSVAASCDDDDDDTNPTPNPLVGTWDATSLMLPTGDAIQGGMALNIVIGSTGTIALNVTGDMLGLCNPGPDCTLSGSWTSTANTITITSGTDVITLNYTLVGEEMTWTGTIEGVATTVVLDKDD